MQIIQNIKEWPDFRKAIPSHQTLGFIPTMGNLHKGHASLYTRSKRENDITVASLFINPTQFNRADDFNHYPRTLEADLQLLEQLEIDYCLLPTEEAMYADGFRFQIQETELCQLMEGKHRPGHFKGVLTVVMKLLNLVKPDRAYFGEKDYQQYLLIRDMVTAFFMNIDIEVCPTIREESGLAYSSRNHRLSATQRLKAETFARIFHQNKSCESLLTELQQEGLEVEYLEHYKGRRFAAVVIGDIRLIDNFALGAVDI